MAKRKVENARRLILKTGPIGQFSHGIGVEAVQLDVTPSISPQEAVQTQINNYYSEWLDMSIPGLGDDTPRECAKTEEGRQKLEKLFSHRRNLGASSAQKFPEEWARNELGL